MKSKQFEVVIEPDDHGYHAYCTALRRLGAVSQGATTAEALRDINEVVQMIIAECLEDGIELPHASIE